MRLYDAKDRAAEDRLWADMHRLDLVGGGQGRSSDEVKASAGSGAAILLVAIVCIVLAVIIGGCGTVAGFGRDLTAISDGVRAEMSKENQ